MWAGSGIALNPRIMYRTVRQLSRIRTSRVSASSLTGQSRNSWLRRPIIERNQIRSWNDGISCSSRNYSSQKVHTPPEDSSMDLKLYEAVCTETLEELSDYFEEILENTSCLDSVPDVLYSDGVLTVKISDKHGTFVINRQTPNRQIWLSSPQSGPKRFDYVPSEADPRVGKWVYKHTGEVLHELLQQELSPIITDVGLDFFLLIHSGKLESS